MFNFHSFADGSYTECNFGPVRANKSIVTKFRNIDHDRFVSDAHIGVFTYTNEETLFSILDSNVCYQDVDQLCQPWVQKLYEIDRQHTDLNNTGTIFHACQCVRYRTVMTYNRMYSRLAQILPFFSCFFVAYRLDGQIWLCRDCHL